MRMSLTLIIIMVVPIVTVTIMSIFMDRIMLNLAIYRTRTKAINRMSRTISMLTATTTIGYSDRTNPQTAQMATTLAIILKITF